MFAVDNRKLYEFQIAQAKLDLFIKALLRLYGGELFRDFFKISEEKIAEVLSIPVSEVSLKTAIPRAIWDHLLSTSKGQASN